MAQRLNSLYYALFTIKKWGGPNAPTNDTATRHVDPIDFGAFEALPTPPLGRFGALLDCPVRCPRMPEFSSNFIPKVGQPAPGDFFKCEKG